MKQDKLENLLKIIDNFKTVSKKEVPVGFIKTKAYEFTLNNGDVVTREKIIKGNKDGSAVIIVPYIDNEILLVVEPRVFTELGVGVGFPAGYIEEGEDPKEAALRELREETGYVPEWIEEVDAYYQDEGCSGAYNHIFMAHNCTKEFEQELDKDEHIEYMTFSEEEVFELERLGYINGGNAKLALRHIKK